MTIPVHRYKKVGKYVIHSYLSLNEVHVNFSTESQDSISHHVFKKDDEAEFTKCFDDLVLIAQIKTSLKK